MLSDGVTLLRVYRRWVDLALVASFVTLRLVAVAGRPIAVLPDTHGYLRLDFTGRDTRLWPVPLLYAAVRDDTARVIVQTLLACAAWVLLAWAARQLASRLVFTAPMAVLLLGLTPQVARWDQAILSESFGISIAVAAIACWVLVATAGHGGWWVAVAVTTVVFGMTRTVQVFLLVAVAVGIGLAALRAGAFRGRATSMAMCAGILVVGAVAGLLMTRNNHGTSSLNFYTVLSDRVVGDEAVSDWFVDHGMPWQDTFPESRGYAYREDIPPDLLEFLDLPPEQAPPELVVAGGFDLAAWVRDDGWSTYVRYLASHPWSTLTGEAERFDMMLDPADFELLGLHPRLPIPRSLFGPWDAWLGAAVALGAATWRRLGRAGARLLVVPAVVLACCVPWFYAISLTSGLEHPRHAITMAICLRVGALLAILVSWDRLTRPPTGSLVAGRSPYAAPDLSEAV